MRFFASGLKRFTTTLAVLTGSLILPIQAEELQTAKRVAPLPTGFVVGTVYYESTHLPARFANIRLVPKPTTPEIRTAPETIPAPGQTSHTSEPRVAMVTGTSGMDGKFHLDGVPVGDYLIAAQQQGYVSPTATFASDFEATDDQLKAVIATLPSVHISLGGTATVNLSLHLGAVVSGRLQYADGSPAIDASVELEPADSEVRNKTVSPLQWVLMSLNSKYDPHPGHATDDEGRYRISGLPPGKYVLNTIVVLNHGPAPVSLSDGSSASDSVRGYMSNEMVQVYGPGVFRRKDARVIEIHGDEQIIDADINIDPEGLHTVKGRVFVGDDHHSPSAAMVQLREEGATQIERFVYLDPDASFQIDYVPAGKYTLVVHANDQNDPDTIGPTVAHEYNTFRLPVIVGTDDVFVGDVLLSLRKPGEPPENIEF